MTPLECRLKWFQRPHRNVLLPLRLPFAQEEDDVLLQSQLHAARTTSIDEPLLVLDEDQQASPKFFCAAGLPQGLFWREPFHLKWV